MCELVADASYLALRLSCLALGARHQQRKN